MSGTTHAAVSQLVRDAAAEYADDPVAVKVLEGYAKRLDGPLRVAIAGMVKAGKSTLLNAIIGEEIAPTDAGECTRIVTWYRYADTPRIMAYPAPGAGAGAGAEPYALQIKRVDGRLVFDIGERHAAEVERLVVDWPAKSLRDVTLIDTPGIASLSEEVSARSTDFLTPTNAPSEADAIVYLMRHLHASDVNFLQSFRDTAAGQSSSVNALAVLSRADEIGGGRVDSLLSAGGIAQRYRQDEDLRSLVLGVVPIAGLLAQSARTLRQVEFEALLELGRLERVDRERLLISVDRFVRPVEGIESSPDVRAQLLDRFGLFGIRLACALVRGGITEPTRLAHELARRSGLGELLKQLGSQLQARSSDLKARAVLAGVEGLLRDRPCVGAAGLAASIERVQSSAHEFQELRLLAMARTVGLGLPADESNEAERLIGGRGIAAWQRLGLAEDAAATPALRAQAIDALQRWRLLAESPLTDRATADVCQIVVRSCEALLQPVLSDQPLRPPGDRSPRAPLGTTPSRREDSW